MSRIVTVITTQGDERATIHTSATTWGELQNDINEDGTFNASSAKAMVRGSRTPLAKDSDALPDGPFSLFLTPEKMKSGK